MAHLTISVTQEDINQGEPEVAWRCPIALAMDRAFGYGDGLGNGVQVIIPCYLLPDSVFPYKLPDRAVEFAQDFDELKDVAPFKFRIWRPVDAPKAA